MTARGATWARPRRANVAEELLARLWTRFRPERRARGRRPSASRDGVIRVSECDADDDARRGKGGNLSIWFRRL